MEKLNKLPISFFEKPRPAAPKNSLNDIIPFKWSDEKGILKGKYKEKKIISLSKRK